MPLTTISPPPRKHKTLLLLQAQSVFAPSRGRSYIGILSATGHRMDIQKIRQLIDLLARSDLSELELVEGELKVRLLRRAGAAIAMPVPQPASAAVITSPLYGVLHLTPSPHEPAFVEPGDDVQAGQTVCVVEAMKMFHEVKADRAAKVLAVLVADGQEVEAGQALFSLAQMD